MIAIENRVKIVQTPRVLQLEGMFDIPHRDESTHSFQANLPLTERPWQIGLIVGPSGSGKTSLARHLWSDKVMQKFQWDENRAVVDSFPEHLGIKEITLLLSSVGFSSPPSWLRPFHVLSNGEQFRVTLARAIAENDDLIVFDEFTSVVDRTVAQIGSAAVAKTIRRMNRKFVAVTCHHDVEEWLCPDWVYDPSIGRFSWRSLRGRPPITLSIARVSNDAWKIFAPHHYLTAELNSAAFCFCAFLNGHPIAFDAWLPFVGRLSYGKARRGHRTVCLPDFQGVGIGNALFETIASMWSSLGYRAFSGTAHPAEINKRARSPKWITTRKPSMTPRGNHTVDRARAANRLTASFEYVGPKMDKEKAVALCLL